VNQNPTTTGDHATLTRGQWLVLLAAFLGWMFDGVEMGLFPIAAPPALRDMMSSVDAAGQAILPADAIVSGYYSRLMACFLLGAAAGGWTFGWLGDKLGRVKMMALAICFYSVFMGLCGFAAEPWHLAVCQFLAALGMGGEWTVAVALVMECWPAKHRPMLAGTIGAAANVGFLLISILGALIAVTTEQWRWFMFAGAAPGVLAIFVLFAIPESKKWKEATRGAERIRPLREVFSSALIKRTVLGILLASISLVGTWAAVSAFLPPWVGAMTDNAVPPNPYAKAQVQIMIAIGAILGCFVGPLLARRFSRRIAYFLLCVGSLIGCQYLFRMLNTFDWYFLLVAGVVGLLTASFYGWLPLYLSELFPTRVRATGQGIAYNSGRILAAIGVLIQGQLIAKVFDGKYPTACATITLVYAIGMVLIWFAPETKDKPLPD
jgi:MFS transporter, SHS family, sialic acid transporter